MKKALITVALLGWNCGAAPAGPGTSLPAAAREAAAPQNSGSASLQVSLTVEPPSVAPGQVAVLTARVVNQGPDVPQNAMATITLAQGLKAQSCDAPFGVTCTTGTGSVTAAFSPQAMQPFYGDTLTIALKVNDNIIKPCPPNTPPPLCTTAVNLNINAVVTSELPNPFTNNTAATFLTVQAGSGPVQMSLSATQLAFGEASYGQQSAPQKITITNTGAGSVLLGPVAVQGDFFLISSSCGLYLFGIATYTSFAPGDSCALSIIYQPQTLGVENGKLLHPRARKVRITGWITNSRLFFGEESVQVVPNMAAESPACR